jgi:hypothetical protein
MITNKAIWPRNTLIDIDNHYIIKVMKGSEWFYDYFCSHPFNLFSGITGIDKACLRIFANLDDFRIVDIHPNIVIYAMNYQYYYDDIVLEIQDDYLLLSFY